MYRTLIIQLCQGKYSFPFYGTFKSTYDVSQGFLQLTKCLLYEGHIKTVLDMFYYIFTEHQI